MDAYTYLLEQLMRDDFRRLRAYTPENRSTFPAWLVVVARRLCVDRLRERYGRGGAETRVARRRLADLLGDELNPTTTADHQTPRPDAAVRARELSDALAAALARLAPSDQLLLKLRYEEELSAREIAQLLHLPTPFHVYRRVQKVLERIKMALEQRGIDGIEP
jgi:RNA polymerase sigma factor (sigma-70 family)